MLDLFLSSETFQCKNNSFELSLKQSSTATMRTIALLDQQQEEETVTNLEKQNKF